MIGPGDMVTLVTDNERINGQCVKVLELTPYGAIVSHVGGQYRAMLSEMQPLQGYTGDVCNTCGGSRMRRNGSCLLCEDCGSTSGCG